VRRRRLPVPILAAAALVAAAASSAQAETIALTILGQHHVSGGQLRVQLDIRNNGDAPARNLMPILAFRGTESLGTFAPSLAPQSTLLQTVAFPLPEGPGPRGVWPVYVRLSYADGNNHPFEALHVMRVGFGAAPEERPAVEVALAASRVSTTGEIAADLRSTISTATSLSFIVPAGLAVTPEQANVFLEPGSRRVVAFVTNAGATQASRLPVFAVVEYDTGGAHRTSLSTAVVEIAAAEAPQPVPSMFPRIVFLSVIALALALATWHRAKRSAAR
jgi:hypothetical protein